VGEEEEGRLIGIGGLAFVDGRVVAFSDLCASARRRKRSLHRVALRAMAEARASGHRLIHAEAGEATSGRWLRRLGFAHEGGTLHVWRG
jgi:hypothetical protein